MGAYPIPIFGKGVFFALIASVVLILGGIFGVALAENVNLRNIGIILLVLGIVLLIAVIVYIYKK